MANLAARIHVDADGKLTVQVPDEFRHTEVQAHVVVSPLDDAASAGWEGYERLAEDIRRQWPRDARTRDVLDEVRG